jgi:hypothetical protein
VGRGGPIGSRPGGGSRRGRLAAVIEPHVVVTQGAPGRVEKGEREQRGSRLLLTTPARTASRIEMSLSVLR